MLGEADAGFLVHAPPNVIAEFPQFRALDSYDELFDAITAQLSLVRAPRNQASKELADTA